MLAPNLFLKRREFKTFYESLETLFPKIKFSASRNFTHILRYKICILHMHFKILQILPLVMYKKSRGKVLVMAGRRFETFAGK